MRFIHTADWHLGRLMYGVRLTDDQAHVLEQLIDLARDTKPDALIVSGDVYDRSVPPPDAVELLDDILSRLVLDLKVPVILIAGNHDGPLRLEFASRVLAGQGVHVFGSIRTDVASVRLEDAWGPVDFFALPYAEPALVREKLACDEARDQQQAMSTLIDRVHACRTPSCRSVVIAHAFVAGGVSAESERPLSVGGVDKVDAACFQGFHYAALGHLHRPQSVGAAQVRYSGSLLKYSFSEVDHRKTVELVDMDAAGACTVERVGFSPRRDVRRIEGYLEAILAGPSSGESSEDYVMVSLLDTAAILDVMGKLREVYPNVLHVERPSLDSSGSTPVRVTDHRRRDHADLFGDFFVEVTGEALSQEQAAAYRSVVDELRRQEREESST
jgi:DNA repair protein SbcD/Mre11